MQRPEVAVAEHQQPAVVAELVAVLAPLDHAVERRVHRRAGRREDVDRHVPRAPAPVRASGTRARCRSRAARRSGRSRARRPAASRRSGRAPGRSARSPSITGCAPRAARAAARTARAFGLASYPHASRKRKCASCGILALEPRQHLGHAGLADRAGSRCPAARRTGAAAIATLIRSRATISSNSTASSSSRSGVTSW